MTEDTTPNLLGVPPWTAVQTEGWLTEYPLPVTFTWPDRYGKERPPVPSYRLKGGYGKWLRETPYFPGLFELCHEILQRAPEDVLLTPEWLADELRAHRRREAAANATLL
jgi:hypothetical protein